MQNPFSIYNPDSAAASAKKKLYGKGVRTHSLSWEESAHGSAENPEDFYEGHGTTPNVKLFLACLALIFVGLATRLGVLQIAHGASYLAQANSNHIREQEILPPRGIVYDSQGTPLVDNVPSFELIATPMDLPKDPTQLAAEVASLAKITGTDAQAALAAIQSAGTSSYEAVSINPNVTHDQSLVFQADASQFPGFSIENNPVREYQNPDVFSNILGYTGKVSPADVSANSTVNPPYSMDDYIGKTGVELTYEKWLRGTPGEEQVEVDATGHVQSVLGTVPAQIGDSLDLNIDAGLQTFLYNDIVAKNNGKKAAAVALDPQNGKVLALVSVPGYDSNLFSTGISTADYDALVNNPQQPLFDRPISGTYPPGSTIKPVMASAALQENVVTPDTLIDDNGDLKVGSYQFHGWKPGGLGMMNMRSAIAMSSDIYFYTVGGGQANLGISGLGPALIEKYDKLFGMGSTFGNRFARRGSRHCWLASRAQASNWAAVVPRRHVPRINWAG